MSPGAFCAEGPADLPFTAVGNGGIIDPHPRRVLTMPDTTRILSGSDVEMNLGAGWFRVALSALQDAGKFLPVPLPPPLPPNGQVEILAVEIVFDRPAHDLAIDVTVDGEPR